MIPNANNQLCSSVKNVTVLRLKEKATVCTAEVPLTIAMVSFLEEMEKCGHTSPLLEGYMEVKCTC